MKARLTEFTFFTRIEERQHMEFSGSYVAIVTPWTKDLSGIDYGALKELIDWHVASGTSGIVPAGTTGESPTLSHKEHKELVEKTVALAGGRIKIMAGACSNSTAESITMAQDAKAAGADSILVITPYFNRPTPEGQYRHFGAIAEACDLPAMIYNIPSRTGTNSTPDIIVRVHRAYPHMRGVKEASGSVDQSSQILAQSSMDVLSGDDSMALPVMAVGGKGVVSVIANIAPAETAELCRLALSGDIVRARELHYRLMPIMKSCFVETNPAPVKTALEIMGKCPSAMRLPMVELRPESKKTLEEALRKVGLIG
jgi:4-hydroxy-tetrahydrodipicolinate synthase